MVTKRRSGITALSLGALGVVFGDIGTSPLYALQAIFGLEGDRLPVTPANILGLLSLLIWTITLVVSVKYIGLIMSAGNKGEGGILALVALLKSRGRWKGLAIWTLVGIVGVSLFFGDSAITPAISVLSAAEGLGVALPTLHSYILPLTIVLLTGLFLLQRYGSGRIGQLFGPVMLLWFVTIAAGGLHQIMQQPGVLKALSPVVALQFAGAHPLLSLLALGAIVLAITGAEALYADMGHFGRPAISAAWFAVVFPALALCYLGQGALMLGGGSHQGNLVVQLFPVAWQLPVALLAIVATLIASQSVIAGAFSLTRQAVHLGLLPKLFIKHTSAKEVGQIYIPAVNGLLFISVVLLVLGFGSSEQLAGAYGVAVCGTLAADSLLFLVVLRRVFQKSWAIMAAAILVLIPMDILLITANVDKIWHGGIIPLALGAVMCVLITTWQRGDAIVARERRSIAGKLGDFIVALHMGHPTIKRLPGAAVFLGSSHDYTPLALHATAMKLHELPEHVVIVTVKTAEAAHIPPKERASFNDLSFLDGICHLTLTYGFHDHVDVPAALTALRGQYPELRFATNKATYIISRSRVVATRRRNLAAWRKRLYITMSHNAASASDYYHLPVARTQELDTLIRL
ncbi:KUP/HAK/KT family potassium transporter [Candidatus Saccharibacteria bacterium]|nr:KUP/HAK/KT family potassium transporter [Candidatus Saccharibacteria bacterium]